MAKSYVILIRGINVGGNSKVPMAELKTCLEKLGFSDVVTYIASGNVLLKSDKSPTQIKAIIEEALAKSFKLSDGSGKVLVLDHEQLQSVIDKKPKGFGEQRDKYHSDVIFLLDISPAEAMTVFDPREGIDTIWQSETVIYSQRLSAERTKSRLAKIVGTKPYKSMTIRTWGTTTKLLHLLEQHEA